MLDVADQFVVYSNNVNKLITRRLVAEARRRSSDLIVKESFLSQVLLPTIHGMVDDWQDVLYFSLSLQISKEFDFFFFFSYHPC